MGSKDKEQKGSKLDKPKCDYSQCTHQATKAYIERTRRYKTTKSGIHWSYLPCPTCNLIAVIFEGDAETDEFNRLLEEDEDE